MSHPITPRDRGHQEPEKDPRRDDAGSGGTREEAEKILPLVKETPTVHKRVVVTGRVRVRTITSTIEEFAKASLRSEATEVTRVLIDSVVNVAPRADRG